MSKIIACVDSDLRDTDLFSNCAVGSAASVEDIIGEYQGIARTLPSATRRCSIGVRGSDRAASSTHAS